MADDPADASTQPGDPGPGLPPRLCSTCFHEIHPKARKCTKCDAFQDWRRHLSISSSVLALLVALVSVLALSAPLISQLLSRDNSDVRVTLQGISENQIFLMATNNGRRAGSVNSASFDLNIGQSDDDAVADPLNFKPQLLPAGAARQIVIKLGDDDRRIADTWWGYFARSSTGDKYVIRLIVSLRNFEDQKPERVVLNLPWRDLLAAGESPWHSCVVRDFYTDELGAPIEDAEPPKYSEVKESCGPYDAAKPEAGNSALSPDDAL